MKEDAKAMMEKIADDIEKESRAPLPWQHYLWKKLDRIEKMLKWIILDKCNDTVREHYRKMRLSDEDLEKALWKKPDISDILKSSEENE